MDEYEDLHRAEQVLMDALAGPGGLTVVRDQDQSIYMFTRAHPETIVEFADRHPGTEDVALEACRRCTKRLVEFASSLIEHNSRRTRRALRPRNGNPEEEVLLVRWRSLEEELGGIAGLVRKRVKSGSMSPGFVLVLPSRRQIGCGIRDELRRLGLSTHGFFH